MRIDEGKKKTAVKVLSALTLVLACFLSYDFYKCLSGFVANGFREPLVMLPLTLSYLLPAVCFLFFIYSYFVKPLDRTARLVYSAAVIFVAVTLLVLIFLNIKLYISNSALGVYDTLPSVILRFPFDAIAIHTVLIFLRGLDIYAVIRSESAPAKFLRSLSLEGSLKIRPAEYLALSFMAIVVFVFSGSAVTAAFTSIENALYDIRFIFLLLWVGLIPMMNLLYLVLKPQKTDLSLKRKLLASAIPLGVNILFALLTLILELTYPDFMAHIGKPLFLIAFSVSLPIEMAGILIIMAIGSVFMAIDLVRARKSINREIN